MSARYLSTIWLRHPEIVIGLVGIKRQPSHTQPKKDPTQVLRNVAALQGGINNGNRLGPLHQAVGTFSKQIPVDGASPYTLVCFSVFAEEYKCGQTQLSPR